jgi:hypothetical protein
MKENVVVIGSIFLKCISLQCEILPLTNVKVIIFIATGLIVTASIFVCKVTSVCRLGMFLKVVHKTVCFYFKREVYWNS